MSPLKRTFLAAPTSGALLHRGPFVQGQRKKAIEERTEKLRFFRNLGKSSHGIIILDFSALRSCCCATTGLLPHAIVVVLKNLKPQSLTPVWDGDRGRQFEMPT